MNSSIPVPFSAARERVRKEWIDYNGHMNVGYYHVAFDTAADLFFDFLGLTAAFRALHGASTFALESHLNVLREVKEGDWLQFEARLIEPLRVSRQMPPEDVNAGKRRGSLIHIGDPCQKLDGANLLAWCCLGAWPVGDVSLITHCCRTS